MANEFVIKKGLIVSGSAEIEQDLRIRGTLTVDEFHTSITTSSIIYESGSTAFGNSIDDTHIFTGSVDITGSISLNGEPIGTGKLDETTFNTFTSSHDVLTSDFNSLTNSYNSFTSSYISHSSSFDSRIDDLESFSSSLDISFVNETEFGVFTSSYNTVSGSLDSRLDVLEAYSGSQLVPSSSMSFRTLQTDVYCKNTTGTQIDKGKVVRIIDSVGDNPLIALADYTSELDSANTLGIATQDIPNDSFGLVITEGILIGVNTSGMTAGQLLFLGTSGSFTTTPPIAPNHGVRLGEVLRVQQNNGSIYVRIDNGMELSEAHDVTYTNISQGDLLVRNGNGVWNNSKQLHGAYAVTGSLTVTGVVGGSNIAAIETATSSLNSFTSSTNSRLNSIEIFTSSINTTINDVVNNGTLVSGSSQIYITGTTGYSTFSGSIATTDANQNSRLDSLETESGSIRSGFNSYTSSNDSTNTSQNNRLDLIETSTASLNSFTNSVNTTIKNKLNSDGVISGSIQVDLTSTTNYSTFSSSIATTDLGQNSRLNSLEQKTGSYATTGSNNFIGDQTITGSVIITENLHVFGSSSITYVTASQLALSTSFISVNVFEPAERFGGLKVYDSGSLSHQATASLAWDSLYNRWVYQNASGSSYSGAMLIAGPRNSGSLGEETALTSGKIPKSVGGDHIDNSIMNETSGVIYITGSLSATGTVSGTNITAIESTTSSLNSYTASNDSTNVTQNNRLTSIETSTGSLNSFTSSTNTRLGLIETATSSLNSYTSSTNTRLGLIETSTGSLNSFTNSINTTIKNKLNSDGVISGSAQVVAALPSGTVSGSSQVLNGTTIHSGSFFNGITVVSGSAQISFGGITGVPSGLVSGSSQVSFGSISGVPSGLVSGSSQVSFGSISGVPSGLVSGSSQVSFGSISGVPSGLVSGSSQITLSSTTGFGSYLNQAVLTSSSPTFAGLTSTSALSVGYSISSEPFVAGHFYNTNTTSNQAYGGVLVSAINQAHIRFQVGSNSWGASGAKQWQIRVGNGGGSDDMRVYSWTAGRDVAVFNTNGNLILHDGSNAGGVYLSDTSLGLYRDNTYDISLNQGGSSDGVLYMGSAGSVIISIDNNNNDTGKKFIVGSNAAKPTNELFSVSENGNTYVSGYLTVNGAGSSSSIYMNDSDEGSREIHCNSNRIGFLTQAGSWGAYLDDNANWFAESSMRAPIFYDSQDTGYYVDPNGTSNLSIVTIVDRVNHNTSSSRNKYNVYGSDGTYCIGMQSAITYGGLNDWGMTFQFNNDDGRGFWWGDNGHNTAQGAMALTTNGNLTVARRIKVGYGETDVTTPTVPLQVYGSGGTVLDIQGSAGQLFSVTDDLTGDIFSISDISGVPMINVNTTNGTSFGSTIFPSANNAYDLGTSSFRWANVYTNDLHLSNEGKEGGNEIDGTTGDWTIQEGAEQLYIINNKNGKKYKIDLTEVK